LRVGNFIVTSCVRILQNRKFQISLLTILLLSAEAFPQAKSDTDIILISDVNIQLEATAMLNDMYNFKFARAEEQMQWFKKKYAWHPLPIFC